MAIHWTIRDRVSGERLQFQQPANRGQIEQAKAIVKACSNVGLAHSPTHKYGRV